MTTQEIIFWLSAAVIGTAASALWSGLETAMYVVSRLRLESRLADPARARPATRLKAELDHPQRALATLLVMNNLSNYLGALALAALLGATGMPAWAVATVNVIVLTPVLFVFAETLPKELFRTRAEHLAYALAPILTLARRLLTLTAVIPAILIITRLAQRALGAAPVAPDAKERRRALLQEAAGIGVLSHEQTELLERVAAFRDTTVGDEMTPWSKARKLRESQSPAQAAAAVHDGAFARLPLLSSRGQVTGMIETADLFPSTGPAPASLASLAKPAHRLTPGTSVPEALRQLRAEKTPLAIVESKGKPIGIVTLKDLVEPLTGELSAW